MFKRALLLCLLCLNFLTVGSAALNPVQAQGNGVEPGETFATNPKDRTTNITATVVDNTPPTTPILVSPTNNSFATVNKPDFVWEASTDANGIGKYQLYLDGTQLYGDLPTGSSETSQYVLVFNSSTNRYTLTPKAGLAEGPHTWKIRASDTLNLSTDSATWSFTIDTAAPSFVITQVGEESTSISAQDISTIPTDPIELDQNQPLLSGSGEANSSVDITITIPGDPTQHVVFSIGADGTWQYQLGILPRDVEITLDFLITDQAGNLSVLSGLKILIKTQVIVFPPVTPSPSSPIGSISPSPEASPLITIPIIPPTEAIHELIQEVTERIPSPITALMAQIPVQIQEAVIDTAQNLAPISALIANAAAPVFTTLAVASQLGGGFSFSLLMSMLQAIGILPKKRPQGLVYNSQTGEPIPFVRLIMSSVGLKQSATESLQETVVTDTRGIYQGIKLPPGKYQIQAVHQEYFFPTSQKRPPLMSFQEFYKGEVFDITSDQEEQLFLIPIDPKGEAQLPQGTWKRLRLKLARVKLRDLTVPLFSFSVLVTTFFPTLLNFGILAIYGLIFAKQAIHRLRIPHIAGKVVDDQGNPLGQGIIRVSQAENNQLVAITTTNDEGEFEVFIKPDVYQIAVTHYGYARIVKGAQLSFEAIDTRQESVYLVITMTDIRGMYKELGI